MPGSAKKRVFSRFSFVFFRVFGLDFSNFNKKSYLSPFNFFSKKIGDFCLFWWLFFSIYVIFGDFLPFFNWLLLCIYIYYIYILLAQNVGNSMYFQNIYIYLWFFSILVTVFWRLFITLNFFQKIIFCVFWPVACVKCLIMASEWHHWISLTFLFTLVYSFIILTWKLFEIIEKMCDRYPFFNDFFIYFYIFSLTDSTFSV